MATRAPPRIETVEAAEEPLTVHVHWKGGRRDVVDLTTLVGTFKVFAPLRNDPDLFRAVSVGEYGTDIVWNEAIDVSNDTLWRLAQNQSDALATHEVDAASRA